MKLLLRILKRILILITGAVVLWFIVTQVFVRLDERFPMYIAFVITYIFSAYLLLPELVRIVLRLFRRKYISRITLAADGLQADPVNIVLTGSIEDLRAAFKAAGWYEADKLTLKTGWKIILHYLRNTPYPTAPFSPLFLFGRKQDVGFENAITNSPRQRDHIRFWAAGHDPLVPMTDIQFWVKKEYVDLSEGTVWVGAATRDVGFGLTELTYEISHRIDRHIDTEREYVLNVLRKTGWVREEKYLEPGELVAGKYITDGRILCAQLVAPSRK
jgi:hypothetical protein